VISEQISGLPIAISEPDTGSPGVVAKPIVEVRGGRGRLTPATLRELWAFREVVGAFTMRQVRVRYKQAVVGIGWSVVQPVAAAITFAVFLGAVAKVQSEGRPYLLFALCGMVCWTYFAGAASTAMESLITDQALLRKVYFPREALPLSAVLASLVDLLPGVTVLAVAAVVYGLPPGLAWLALPIPLLLLVVSAAALGLGLSGINAYYRDVRHALPFILQLGLFASPVVYPLGRIPGRWRSAYAIGNPVAAAIDGLRRIVLHQQLPDLAITAGAFAWATVGLLLGFVLFKRLERGLSDRI
jgi:lipopolysaccharide transport system permease protein